MIDTLYNGDAERALIGSALIDPGIFLTLDVDPKDFYLDRMRLIWTAGRALAQGGKTPDVILLADELGREGHDVTYAELSALLTKTVSAVHADSYAATVREWANRRALFLPAQNLMASLSKNGRFEEAAEKLRDALTEVTITRGGAVTFRSAAEIAAFYGQVEWSWPAWVPIGYLTMIVGPQAQGKSYLAARLTATLTGSLKTWPDGSERQGLPAKVLIVETEELRGLYVARLDAMGVNRERYVFGPGDETHIPDLGKAKEMAAVERLAVQQGVGAIVVDSLSGAHQLDERDEKMRPMLQGLAAIATRLRVPVILVHHVRKRASIEPVTVTLDRVRGSSTITQFCRSVIALYRLEETDQTGPVKMQTIKTTFCAPPPALGFTVGDRGLEFGAPPEEAKVETQLDRATELLRVMLGKGPVASGELRDEADEAGISWETMKRAKDALKIVVSKRREKGGKWYWALPAPAPLIEWGET